MLLFARVHTILDCVHMLRKKLPAAQISVEIEKPGRQGLPELAAEVDVIFYSRTWAEVCHTIPYKEHVTLSRDHPQMSPDMTEPSNLVPR